ncbi:hypothetical protein N781_11555 [Pontibacillus halophilus JSM 076056 = DSM 19796]|uniref:DUF4190 domain-containing protein n=1 Tax=Pontibacillus halophilus JSM 076056 = DSM 19796 TaxID=1385510 RepID=A0A0A5G747_9BACI|nr:hypothetical protein [Pontibacillus halophilus]KGX87884.1 hypothetical protein N781_11555 [Pontibacillus halophilus JSM 076056 = DSM 19796]
MNRRNIPLLFGVLALIAIYSPVFSRFTPLVGLALAWFGFSYSKRLRKNVDRSGSLITVGKVLCLFGIVASIFMLFYFNSYAEPQQSFESFLLHD